LLIAERGPKSRTRFSGKNNFSPPGADFNRVFVCIAGHYRAYPLTGK